MENVTDVSASTAFDNVIVNVTPEPSVAEAFAMLNDALSSLLIVADAVLVIAAICVAVVPVTAPRLTENVSLASTIVSPLIVTVTLCDSPTVPAKCSVVVSNV